MKNIVSYVKNNTNTVLVGVAIVAIVITAGLIFVNSNHGFALPTLFGKSDQQIGKDAVNYINNNQLSTTPATLVKVGEASGLVKVTIKIGTSTFDSYATKDGKLLFPQAFDMTPKKAATKAAASKTPAATAANVQKVDKPMLEAFVVSSCPFGLQMQRAIADAVIAQPALAQNVKVRYIGSIESGQMYSMHDTTADGSKRIPNGPEATENLRQICIREEQPTKFYNYLACYMKKASGSLPNGMPLGDSAGCLASTGVDTGSVNACMKDSGRGLAYAQKDFDENTKYNVSGSPTLILNGAQIDESGFGGRSSDGVKTMVCDGSKTAPSFCSTKLKTAEAAASFSATYASSGTSGTGANTKCGS